MATRGTVPRWGILRLVLDPRRAPEPRVMGNFSVEVVNANS
jgi:hypothetical protein